MRRLLSRASDRARLTPQCEVLLLDCEKVPVGARGAPVPRADRSDGLLPDEPVGYAGFQGLFGHKYVAPQIHPDGPLDDLSGNPIQDPSGNLGFRAVTA